MEKQISDKKPIAQLYWPYRYFRSEPQDSLPSGLCIAEYFKSSDPEIIEVTSRGTTVKQISRSSLSDHFIKCSEMPESVVRLYASDGIEYSLIARHPEEGKWPECGRTAVYSYIFYEGAKKMVEYFIDKDGTKFLLEQIIEDALK